MIKTVIFDMDGVIVDTEPVHYYAYQKHFEQLNIEVSDDLYATFTGNSTKNVYQKLKEKFDLKEDIETLIQTKRSIFNTAFDEKEDLYLIDGVAELIETLYQSEIQLILASSSAKETIHKVFTRFNLHRYFSHIVSGEDFPKSKPHPAIFLHAASLSIAPKENCIVIEDSTNGVVAAKEAGLKCIGYKSKNSKNQDLSLADLSIDNFSKIDFEKILF